MVLSLFVHLRCLSISLLPYPLVWIGRALTMSARLSVPSLIILYVPEILALGVFTDAFGLSRFHLVSLLLWPLNISLVESLLYFHLGHVQQQSDFLSIYSEWIVSSIWQSLTRFQTSMPGLIVEATPYVGLAQATCLCRTGDWWDAPPFDHLVQ